VQEVSTVDKDPVVAGFDFFALGTQQATENAVVGSNWLIVRNYPSTPPLWPPNVYLRAGNKAFGYEHLVKNGRWNPWFDGMMGVTVRHPNAMKAEPPSTQLRFLKIRNCPQPYNFKVVIQEKGSKTHPNEQKGIITAVQEFLKAVETSGS